MTQTLRHVVVVSALLALAGCAEVAVATYPSEHARVVRVIDGDTVLVSLGGAAERVRVLGIQSPESVHPDLPVQCWGPESAAFAAGELTVGERVELRRDPTQDDRDRFGRLLRYVIGSDGVNFSVQAAEAGAARSYVYRNRPVTLHREIVAAELRAQRDRRGLWRACDPA